MVIFFNALYEMRFTKNSISFVMSKHHFTKKSK